MSYQWIHREKGRYYQVHLVQDLWGECVLVKSWGSLSTRRGGQQSVLCGSLDIAEEKVAAIARRRRTRHYQPVS
jgi:hypothetical protein